MLMVHHFSHSSVQGFVPCKSQDSHQVQAQLVCSTETSIDFPEPCHRIRGAHLSSLFQPALQDETSSKAGFDLNVCHKFGLAVAGLFFLKRDLFEPLCS